MLGNYNPSHKVVDTRFASISIKQAFNESDHLLHRVLRLFPTTECT